MTIDPNNLAATATLTFRDEFNSLNLWNGTSGTWDTNFTFGGSRVATFSGNGEQQWYIDDLKSATSAVNPWTVANGVLHLTAAKADAAISPLINNYQYTSGMISSAQSFSQTYGYFEMRADLPGGQGLWPAFWMMPVTGSWRPELDIFEVLGKETTRLWNFVHPADVAFDAYNSTVVADMAAGFHTYGVDWEADKITWYFDGKQTFQATTPPEMNGPMYLITNLAVGGSWGGPPNASTQFPSDLQIDYIRAYKDAPPAQPPGPAAPTLAIGPASVSHPEGASGTTDFVFTVTRSGDLSATSTANWTVSGSGAAPASASDFAGATLPSGVVSFAAGQATATLTVRAAGDTVVEPDEAFAVTLSGPSGATLTTAAAQGLITNDDAAQPPPPPPPPPSSATTITISSPVLTQSEGTGGTNYFVYTVTRSGDLGPGSTADWAVTGSGANPANAADFTGGVLPSSKVWFGGNESVKQIWVAVNGDSTPEQNEGFTLTLSNPQGAALATASQQGVITNDDGAAPPPPPPPGPVPPSLAIGPATLTLAEGAGGATTAFAFTVTRTGDLSATSTAGWSVAGSGATPANAADFAGGVLPSGSVNFAIGQASVGVTVNVAGDTVVESDERFTVTLANPSGATVGTAAATGVIGNDDGAQPAPANVVNSNTGRDWYNATAGNDVYVLDGPGDGLDTIFFYDAGGSDSFQFKAGGTGFVLLNQTGPGAATIVDVSGSGTSIANADIVRWTGAVVAMDSVTEVDNMLRTQAGTFSGGVLVVAYTPGEKAAVYYDSAPNAAGGVTMLVDIDNLTSNSTLNNSDFVFI